MGRLRDVTDRHGVVAPFGEQGGSYISNTLPLLHLLAFAEAPFDDAHAEGNTIFDSVKISGGASGSDRARLAHGELPEFTRGAPGKPTTPAPVIVSLLPDHDRWINARRIEVCGGTLT